MGLRCLSLLKYWDTVMQLQTCKIVTIQIHMHGSEAGQIMEVTGGKFSRTIKTEFLLPAVGYIQLVI
jgi:hypothetical protein